MAAGFPSPSKSSAFRKRKACASALRLSAAARWWARLDEELLSRQDAQGISIRKAIENFGLNPAEIASGGDPTTTFSAIWNSTSSRDQCWRKLGRPLGVVEAIAGQSRLEFIFVGRANHAGTTPMNLRHDALAGAAEWITAVERQAQNAAQELLVATVGAIQAKPGATNVIAGEARLRLDVRHQSDEARKAARGQFCSTGGRNCRRSVGLRAQLERADEPASRGHGSVSGRASSKRPSAKRAASRTGW